MAKLTKLETFAQESGLELVSTTTVWNIHSESSLASIAKKKGSNLNKEFAKLQGAGVTGGFTIVVGCIGRSQRSATQVGIFKGVNDNFYNDQVFINDANAKFFK